MSTTTDDIQAAGSDTWPPMLDRTDYESWAQRIRMYFRGKENGVYILQSIDEGPYQMGTTRDTVGTTNDGGVTLGLERPRTYDDLNENEKKRFDVDIRAINIVLQGIPKDIYKLINHNIKAKGIWDNVKMLLAGSDMTKEDCESQLYDEFERFKMIPGENITDYYVRFHKLVNDMRNIRMTMPNIQLNSKFVNNMTPEWDRFVTTVKLNKGLKETNHEQLYAYLKQHEKHAAYDRQIIDRFNPTTNDPLALVSHVQPHNQISHVQSHQHSAPSSSIQPFHVQPAQNSLSVENSQLDSGYTQTDQMIEHLSNQVALLAQQFRATLPQTNNQLRTSSNTRNQATMQDGRVVVQNIQGRQIQNQRNLTRGTSATGNGGALNRAGNTNQGQGKPIKCYNYGGFGHTARNCTQPKRPQNSDYFKEKMLLMQAQDTEAVLDEEELLFLAGEQGNTYDADVDDQPVQDLAQNDPNIFQADDCDAFHSDVDDEPTAQTIFMVNLSFAVSSLQQAGPSNASILSEVLNLENAIDHHEIPNKVQQTDVLDSDNVDMGNSNVIPYEQYVNHNEESVVPRSESSVQYDDYMLHENSEFVPDDSITTTLNIYKDQVGIYEQRAKFELTDREQKMDDQMRMLIQERNFRENKLKNELHLLQLQLRHTIQHKKIIQDSVNTLQQAFKQKETKLVNDFSRLTTLKNKLENKLYAQDQSIQTIHMMLKPKKLCDENSDKAMVDPNPFCLKMAKMAQPALYDGNEVLKPDHVPIIVPMSEADRELADRSREKMNEKLKDPESVKGKLTYSPPNYSKENFLATFTPQTQMTPEQVFWSFDLEKRKAEDLKANTPPLRKLAAATVYPPNTPVHLVLGTLPTKCQTIISIFVLNQLFDDFDKTYKKRITPTGITEGERGFEQTKRCYLTEDVFYTVTESVLTASHFHELSNAYNDAMNRVVEVEAENLNLHKKIQNDDHDNMVTHLSRLEVDNLNLQLKYQHLKDRIETSKSVTSKDAPEFDAFFKLNEKDAQLQTHRNTIHKLKAQIS
ncbi:retrovirus-related pol polyprotein from transposon TNT 1-94 [Tanacetum coccineum]